MYHLKAENANKNFNLRFLLAVMMQITNKSMIRIYPHKNIYVNLSGQLAAPQCMEGIIEYFV